MGKKRKKSLSMLDRLDSTYYTLAVLLSLFALLAYVIWVLASTLYQSLEFLQVISEVIYVFYTNSLGIFFPWYVIAVGIISIATKSTMSKDFKNDNMILNAINSVFKNIFLHSKIVENKILFKIVNAFYVMIFLTAVHYLIIYKFLL